MTDRFSKREFLIGGGSLGLVLLAAGPSESQESTSIQLNLTAEDVGALHSQQVFEAGKSVVENDVFGRESLSAAVQRLVELGLISESEARQIVRFIDAVLDGETLDDIVRVVENLFEEIAESLDEVAAAIAGIIRDSVRIAREFLASEEVRLIILAISHDVMGAMTGAAALGFVGSIIPGFGTVTGAVLGALAGATASSTIGMFHRQT